MRFSRLLAALALAAVAHAGQAPRVEVISTLGPAVDEQTLAAVRAAQRTYSRLGLALRKPHLPVQVILVPTVIELAPHIGPGTGRSRAFSFPGADRNYIVLAWAAPGNPLRAAAHEYAHLVDPLAEAPVWFREGFAEYLSYLEPAGPARLAPAAPERHVVRLRDSPWLPFEQLWEASRSSEAFSAPTFYAQCWLTVHWLASRGGAVREMRPADLEAARSELGDAGLENALRAWFEQIDPAPSGSYEIAQTASAPESAWRVRLALAEVDRELGRTARAREALERLQAERPGEPSVLAARGAFAMDEGLYDEAERLLEMAAADADATARTRHRLALMLLRPKAERTRDRARAAATQARQALESFPRSPEYRLALAQALMVSEQWDASARELGALSRHPGWRQRADDEMNELQRRRQQALGELPRPPIASSAPDPPSTLGEPLELAAVPKPPKPPPPPPMRWPPPGATILAGRIDWVDCTGPEKIIVMRHPFLSYRIRDPRGKPAKLFHSPEKDWTEIPCGAKGWTVNIAYYPYRNKDRILGDAAAILF